MTSRAGENLKVSFDTSGLVIPDLSYRTTSIIGVPMPPPLNIAISPQKLEGDINLATGQIDLMFESNFCFTVGGLYQAPPLVVRTVLTTESSSGEMRQATGKRLQSGHARLVGVARVPRVEELFTDTFLMLPTDALAILSAEFEFQ